MKKFNRTFQYVFLALVLFVTSCTDENTPGDDLSDDRDDFVGLWSVTESSKIFGQSVYDSEIIKNSSISSNIAIDNFYQLGTQTVIQARVSGNQLTIPTQVTATNQTISGSGQLLDKNTIELNYVSDDGGDVDSISSIYNRK